MLSGNALFEIAKIRIKQKDFYEAFHNLQRAVHYDFKSKKFVQYKMFVEGVSYIINNVTGFIHYEEKGQERNKAVDISDRWVDNI
jgi:hypothetical protein